MIKKNSKLYLNTKILQIENNKGPRDSRKKDSNFEIQA